MIEELLRIDFSGTYTEDLAGHIPRDYAYMNAAISKSKISNSYYISLPMFTGDGIMISNDAFNAESMSML